MTSRETPPPPVIGKAGRYTVFITPPPTPRPSESSRSRNSSPSPSPSPKFSSPRNVANLSPRVKECEKPAVVVEAPPLPRVQVPPPQFEKGKRGKESGSMFGFFWDAIAKVQDAHSSLDQYLAEWLGLDQSRYQWALNDYYENSGSDHNIGKLPFKGLPSVHGIQTHKFSGMRAKFIHKT